MDAVTILGLLIFFGIHFQVAILPWVISLAVYLVGLIWQVIEYAEDNETLMPDILVIIGTAIIGIWGAGGI